MTAELVWTPTRTGSRSSRDPTASTVCAASAMARPASGAEIITPSPIDFTCQAPSSRLSAHRPPELAGNPSGSLVAVAVGQLGVANKVSEHERRRGVPLHPPARSIREADSQDDADAHSEGNERLDPLTPRLAETFVLV
jgi:hypothetical protein